MMMKRYTEKELWAFVNRADTHERIQTAADFLAKQDYLDVDVFDDMMDALAFMSRELYRLESGRESVLVRR